jgi:hypothetical protein
MSRRSDAELAIADRSGAFRGQREYMDASIAEQPQMRRELPVRARLHTICEDRYHATRIALQSRIQSRAPGIWCILLSN